MYDKQHLIVMEDEDEGYIANTSSPKRINIVVKLSALQSSLESFQRTLFQADRKMFLPPLLFTTIHWFPLL